MNKSYAKLGKLATLGPTEPWQVAFYLPEKYVDLSKPVDSGHDLHDQNKLPAQLTIVTPPKLTFPAAHHKARRPWTSFRVSIHGHEYPAKYFGDTRGQEELFQVGRSAVFLATANVFQGQLSLILHEPVPDAWIGRVMPIYAGKTNVIASDQVRDIVHKHLPHAIPTASVFIKEHISAIAPQDALFADIGADRWTVEQIITQCHLPSSLRHAHYAHRIFQRIAGIAALGKTSGNTRTAVTAPIMLRTVSARIQQMPFKLTDDQARAIAQITNDLAQSKPMNRILSGDVGTGKTAAISVISAAMADQGKRTLILLPNSPLASQVHREISQDFPDIHTTLVTSETVGTEDLNASVLIGTSALLHRKLPHIDLVVIDEQHRWSRAQREQCVGQSTHLLEMTATPIPRTQALLQLGKVAVSEMRQTANPKTFITALYAGADQIRQYNEQVSPLIRAGEQILVVYPKRDNTEEDEFSLEANDAPAKKVNQIDDKYSVESAAQRWMALYPGKVAAITSNTEDADKQRILDDFKAGRVTILITTTVVEVGLNLPNLYRIVIVRPERYGMVTLHQLRGRTARKGGEGFCDLLCPEPLNEKQLAKLNFFCRETDGFKIAEFDLQQRGAGDLSRASVSQSGADDTFLYGIKLDIGLLNEVLPVFERWVKPRCAA